jgi:hypothetical protein
MNSKHALILLSVILLSAIIVPVIVTIAWRKVAPAPQTPPDPLVGFWRQASETPCNGEWLEERRVSRLAFDADHQFFVMFHKPPADYDDAWGTYEYDYPTGQLILTLAGVNDASIPQDFDGDGTAVIDLGERISKDTVRADRLILNGIAFNQSPHGPTCEMMFVRYPIRVSD